MKARTMISLQEVCEYFHFDYDLALEFEEFDMFPVIIFKRERAKESRINENLKRTLTMRKNLGIGMEGMNVILTMREKMSGLEDELDTLRSEVDLFKQWREGEDPAVLEELDTSELVVPDIKLA
jgi:hypothetical protein